MWVRLRKMFKHNLKICDAYLSTDHEEQDVKVAFKKWKNGFSRQEDLLQKLPRKELEQKIVGLNHEIE